MLKKAKDTARLDQAIEELENVIIGADPETEKYLKMVATLETLYKLRNGERPQKMETKDLLTIFTPLLGILILCIFEAYGHTIVSKGLSFVPKLKS